MEIINCVSRNNTKELFVNNGATIVSRNTLATNSDSLKLKVISTSGGTIQILNDTLLN